MKRPAFQFYPADWRKDQALRLCSAGARALWVDMLCLMHEGDPYGHLTVLDGRPMAPEALARLVGESPASVKRWLSELETNTVLSKTADGVVFSRRMVRDEEVREARASGGEKGREHGAKGASHGAKGGRPRKVEAGSLIDERGDNKPPLKPPPSSSSSSPSSEEDSEDKSSGANGAEPDLDKVAWDGAVEVLTRQGGMTSPAAKGLFGKILKDHRLRAKDMLPAVSGAQVSATLDPQGYLTAAAKGIGARAAPREPARMVGFV